MPIQLQEEAVLLLLDPGARRDQGEQVSVLLTVITMIIISA